MDGSAGVDSILIGVEARTLQVAHYGVARYLNNILENCLEIEGGHRYLMYLSEDVDTSTLPVPEQERLHYSVLRAKPSIIWRHLRLPLQMRKDGCDLHFSPSYFVPLLKVCPYVVAVFDITFKVHPEWFAQDKRMLFDAIFWRKVAKAEAIITSSEYSKQDLIAYLGVGPERIRVIYPGVESHFRPLRDEANLDRIRTKYGMGDEFILTVGALHTRRNVPRLLQALARIESDSGRPQDILFVGSQAPFSPPIDVAALAREAGLQGKTGVVDYVAEEDLVRLYNACTLLAYPSLYEGFGLPVLEALACGTPVVCSNVTSIPEVAGDAALYFDPYNVDDMVVALGTALHDPALRDRLGRAGIERAGLFSWRAAAESTLALFDEVVRM
jgi:glycosyltransferase involved in cell wall biosynthesis